jgi:hypothetical protein
MPEVNLNPYTAENAAIQRRLQMAQMLSQEAMQPMQLPQQQGVRASHLAGLAKVLQGYMAGKEEKEATEAYKNLAEKYQAGNRAEMGSFLEAMQGAPERAQRLDPQEVQQMADQGTPMPPNMPAVAPDRTRAMALALGSQNPTLQGAGGAMLSSMMTPKAPINVAAGGTVFDPNTMQPIFTSPKERVPNATESEYNLAKQQGYKGSFVDFLQNVKRTPPNQNVTYGSLVAAVGADGKPVFIQPGKGGGAPSVIEGFSPPTEKLRPIPPSINTAIIENQRSGNQLDRAISLLSGQDLPGMVADKNATGLKGYLPTGLLNRLDPSGVSARAEIADIGSLKIHDRSGSAVTISESPRLMPFIPLTTDDRDTVLKKLQRLKLEIDNYSSGMKEIYSAEQGYRENPILNKPSVNEKITSMQEIQDVATKTGKSIEQVKQDALAKGYKVQ